MKRIEELDFIKAIAITMVVIGHTHCPTVVHNMFYLVHVPIFFIIAGCTCRDDEYFAVNKNLYIFFLKRIKSLYIPFLKYSLPIIILHNAFYSLGLYSIQYNLKDYSFQVFRTLLFSIGEKECLLPQLWFLKVLFLMEIIYGVIIWCSHKLQINKYIVMVPLTLAATTINPNILPHVCFMNIILPIRAMAYYVLGKTMMLQFRFTNKQFGFHYVIVILCLWMFFSFRYHTSFQESSGIIGIVQIITTVSVCLAILQIALTIKQKCKRSYLILCKLGKNTMPIYCLHYLGSVVKY